MTVDAHRSTTIFLHRYLIHYSSNTLSFFYILCRYDFVVSDGRYPCSNKGSGGGDCSHQGQMPKLQSLLSSNPDATRTFRYIAEAPTTTTQRLKSMVSGSLPTFFDISNAFTARPIDEDNLIDQMTKSNWSLAFMGDTTWTNLFPTSFTNFSQSFPCFNVMDLDTVDDGIWKNLLPTLRDSATWDGLIAHYLGVDHAGHAHGVESTRMQQKLQQMDEHIAAVVEEMVNNSGQGGAFEDALLLIAGDHGQTMGGDHGGGSPEEVDSVLVAVDIANVASLTSKSRSKEKENQKLYSERRAVCLENCSCGEDKNQCAEDLPQIDLVPTLSAMLNLPIPFGNMGKLSPGLWSLASQRCSGSGSSHLDEALLKATASNAAQVHRYLNTYASHTTARFPAGDLKKLNAQFDALPSTTPSSNNQDDGDSAVALRAAVDAYLEFLNDAQLVTQQVWTQFNDLSMLIGLLLFAASLVLHLRFSWTALVSLHSSSGTISSKSTLKWWNMLTRKDLLLIFVPWMGVILHFIGIFSFFYLLSEGRCTALILLAVTGLLTAVQTFSSSLSSFTSSTTTTKITRKSGQKSANRVHHRRSSQFKLVVLGMLAAGCISLSSYLGLLGHSGYGFWQRLTVHEPREEDNTFVNEGRSAQNGSSSLLKNIFESGAEIFSATTTLANVLGPQAILLGQYLINYGIPVFLLHQLIGAQLKKSDNIVKTNAVINQIQRFLISVSFLILAVHDALEQKILPSIEQLHSTMMAAPLNLLLPRLVLLTGSVSLLLALVNAVFSRTTRQPPSSEPSLLIYSKHIVAILGSILPIMLLISSTVTPLLALFCVVEAMALTALVAARATNSVGATVTTAAVFSLLQTHIFFVTGHLPEFAGVQYTAGFVGYEEFDLVRSAALVVLDTFGGVAVVGLGLVLAAAVLDGQISAKSSGLSAKTRKSASKTENTASVAYRKGSLRVLLLLFGLNRAVAAFCATLSAGIQRRHLYAWSLFAPRFVFEVLFLALTDIMLVVLGCWTGC